MKSVRDSVHDIIAERILPWIERDGIINLILPEQITPADRAGSERCSRPGYRHREPELAIALTGKMPYCIAGKMFVFTPGAMVLLPAQSPHAPVQTTLRRIRNIDLDKPSSVLWITAYPFGARVQVTHVAEGSDLNETTPPYMLLEHRFARLIGDLLEEVRDRPSGYARVGKLILMEFMERCLRATAVGVSADKTRIPTRRLFQPVSSGSRPRNRLGRVPRERRPTSPAAKVRSKKGTPGGPASKQIPSRVQAAQNFIQSNYYALINLDDIADAADTNPDYLSRRFKAAVGMSPTQYLLNVRIEAARELMLTDLKVHEVANLVGIEDPYYFSRIFRRTTGVSPIQYRRKMAKAEFLLLPLTDSTD